MGFFRSAGPAAALLLALLASCGHPYHTVRERDLEVLLRLPGEAVFSLAADPQGALVVGTSTGVYRSTPHGKGPWRKLLDDRHGILEVAAPAADVVIARTHSDRVLRWTRDGGAVEVPLPVPPRLSLTGLWAKSAEEFHVVGVHGTVVRCFRGACEREGTPLPPPTGPEDPNEWRSRLYAVGGGGAERLAAGYAILRRQGGGWAAVPPPDGPDGMGSYLAVAGDRSSVLVGGGNYTGVVEEPRLLRWAEGRWEVLHGRLAGFRQGISGGASQRDHSALFWSYTGEFAHVRGNKVDVYRPEPFGQFAGAVKAGKFLVLGGTRAGTGVVARVNQP